MVEQQARSPVAIIGWVLAACVVFVGAGIWLTQPSSNAEEWEKESDDEWVESEKSHDTFEDAWKKVWKSGGSKPGAGESDDRDELAGKKESRKDKESSASSSSSPSVVEATPPVAPEAAETAPVAEDVASLTVVEEPASSVAADPVTDPVADPANLQLPALGLPLTNVASESSDFDPELSGAPVEGRVVTLRLSGSVGGTKLNPRDGYTWGRIAYHLQRERKPPYFVVFPGGTLSGVVGPPREAQPGEKQTIQGAPSMRPAGKLGSPLFVINILATVESAGTMTFYGRGVAQKYRCVVQAQVVYLGGEKPEVVDTFSVSESDTVMQGRVAAGPPGTSIYYKALEKLISRLRSTTYFR